MLRIRSSVAAKVEVCFLLAILTFDLMGSYSDPYAIALQQLLNIDPLKSFVREDAVSMWIYSFPILGLRILGLKETRNWRIVFAGKWTRKSWPQKTRSFTLFGRRLLALDVDIGS